MLPLLAVTLWLTPPSIQAKIDDYVRPYVERRDFSGTILVRQNGKNIYEKSFGNANFELAVPNKRDTVFRIASLTKTFTSGAIYLLDKRGQLAFTDKLSKYLPTFPKADSITIAQLLGHASGVGAPDMTPYMQRQIPLDEVIDIIAKAPFEFEPGKKTNYSNSGYTILSKIIEVVSGKSYDQFLRDEFITPLGMTSTGNFRQTDFLPNRAAAYLPGPYPVGVTPVAGFDEMAYLGAGSLFSSADDLAKWLDAVDSKRFYDIDKLSWPMGWGKRTYFGKRANEQTGISIGYTSGMITFPNDHLQVIVLSNVQTQFSGRAVKDIAGIVLGTDPPILPSPKFVDVGEVDQSTVLGKYTIDGSATLEIVNRGGNLYYHWNQDPDFRFLAPTGKTSVYARDEFGDWSWQGKDKFTWIGPFGKLELKRI